MKPITADQVTEPLFNFVQLAFAGKNTTSATSLEQHHANALMIKITTIAALPIKEVFLLPPGERRALEEILTQYIMFLTMFRDLEFPAGFLDGTDETRIGKALLRYVAKHQWPYPQMLPWRADT